MSRSVTEGSSPSPGFRRLTAASPSIVESAVKLKKLNIATTPIRPKRLRLPKPAIPTDNVDTISGITTIIKAFSQTRPIGSVTELTNCSVPAVPPVNKLMVIPSAAPTTRPRRIFVWRAMCGDGSTKIL